MLSSLPIIKQAGKVRWVLNWVGNWFTPYLDQFANWEWNEIERHAILLQGLNVASHKAWKNFAPKASLTQQWIGLSTGWIGGGLALSSQQAAPHCWCRNALTLHGQLNWTNNLEATPMHAQAMAPSTRSSHGTIYTLKPWHQLHTQAMAPSTHLQGARHGGWPAHRLVVWSLPPAAPLTPWAPYSP